MDLPVKNPPEEHISPQAEPTLRKGGRFAAYFQQPHHYFYLAGFLAFFIFAINLGIILWIKDQPLRSGLSDIISPVVDLLAGIALFFAAKYSFSRSRPLGLAWGAITLAMLLYVLGDITWLILEVGLKIQPFPSLADGFYLAFYPVTLVGVLLLLDRSVTTGQRINRGIDIGIVMLAAILGFWNFLIGPIISSTTGQPLLEQGILISYPVGDLVILGALLLLIYNRSNQPARTPIILLAASLLVTIIADAIYSYQSLLGTYVSGSLLDLSWIVSSILIGMAGISQLVAMRSTGLPMERPLENGIQERLKSFQIYLPYLWVIFALLLLIRHGMGLEPLSMSFLSISLGVAGIIFLVLIRQIITLVENNKLNIQLRGSMDRIQAQAVELEQTNRDLVNDIAGRKQAEAARRSSEALFHALFELSPDAILLIDPYDPSGDWPVVDCNVAACLMNGYSRDELIGHSIDVINEAPFPPDAKSAYLQQVREAGILRIEARHRRKDGSVFFTDVATTFIVVEGRELLVGIDHDVTERKWSEDKIKRDLVEFEAINKVSAAMRTAQTLDEMLPALLDTTLEVLNATQGAVWLYDESSNELRPAVGRGWGEQAGISPQRPVKPGEGMNGYVFASRQALVAREFLSDPHLPEAARAWVPPGLGGATIPIISGEKVLGTLSVNVTLPRELSSGEVHLLGILTQIAGNAIHRTMLHQQTEQRLQQFSALSNINQAISSTFDLNLILGILLDNVSTQLHADATDVLLVNSGSYVLEFSAGRGFRTKAFERARLSPGEGFAGRIALKRENIHVPDLAVVDNNPRLIKHLADEQFVGYYGVPLIAKGQVKGVLEIFQRSLLNPDKEWLDFLGLLASQAAIAIDSVVQFENLQRSNSELSQAYDETIEGWSSALDLRDKETEGHTQRVAEFTVRLARRFNLGEAELVQMRWGALLHDIGKMGVPDGILLKPGPLTPEEQLIMRKHPVFAYQMLSSIKYLRLATDIPYHHHEKWDGSGYPLALKGEQIPLTARIFAVVDVWDALTSDRPYREAWSREKALAYIQEQSGRHFDPVIVEAFLMEIQSRTY